MTRDTSLVGFRLRPDKPITSSTVLLLQSFYSVILSNNNSRAAIKMKMTKRRLAESISNILLFNVYTAKHVTDMFQVPKQQLT